LVRRLWSSNPGLDVVHRNAAGIDVGNEEHYVAIAPTQDEVPVQRFNCFTAELIRMAVWLKGRGVQTVAMQSTGVYWIPLYDILEEHGIEVYLVNARDTKNLPGRKTDVQESQWLLKLHTYGLLRNSFRPASEIRVLRAYWRQRDQHVKTAGQCVQRIQKALTQMNLQLANVISDLSGKTGLQILRAVVNGSVIQRSWPTFAILGSKPVVRILSRAFAGTGVQNSYFKSNKNWLATTFAKRRLRNAIANWNNSCRAFQSYAQAKKTVERRKLSGRPRNGNGEKTATFLGLICITSSNESVAWI
jgi:transposase